MDEPAALGRLGDVALVDEAESEVEAGLQAAGAALAEDVADGGDEAGERHVESVAVGDAYVAHHHGGAGGVLQGLVPELVLGARAGGDGELEFHRVARQDDDVVAVGHLIFNGVAAAVLAQGDDARFFRLLVVRHDSGCIGAQLDFLLEVLRFVFLLRRAAGGGG